jgi:hypothetical protein
MRSGGVGKADLLGAAAGYAVFDPRGRRIGLVIELADDPESGGQRLAIRREGVVVWRRRLVPLEAIERVDAERRFVVVAEDRDPVRVVPTPEPTHHELLGRIDAYTRPESVRNGEEATPGLEEEERSVTRSTPVASDRYLRFVSTPSGYRLEEQDGEPPALGTAIKGIDLPERLVVVKLGPSPLPHDSRVCAFLEPENSLVASPARSRAS